MKMGIFLSTCSYICSSIQEDHKGKELSHVEEDTLGINWERGEHEDNSYTKKSFQTLKG